MVNNLNSVNNLGQAYYAEAKEKDSAQKKNDMSRFFEMEYMSKLDGKTYIAQKIILKENEKALPVIYVFEKGAKPDENGNINGEFMSFETFMKKLGDELPTMTSKQVKAYNHNIRTMTPEEKFDKGLANGVKLSDGSTLVRPNTIHTGHTEIKSLGKGLYEVKSTSFVGGYKHAPEIRVISEKQLLANKFLCAGTIKELEDGTYDVRSFDHDKTKEKVTVVNQDKDYCITMMGTNFIHF